MDLKWRVWKVVPFELLVSLFMLFIVANCSSVISMPVIVCSLCPFGYFSSFIRVVGNILLCIIFFRGVCIVVCD